MLTRITATAVALALSAHAAAAPTSAIGRSSDGAAFSVPERVVEQPAKPRGWMKKWLGGDASRGTTPLAIATPTVVAPRIGAPANAAAPQSAPNQLTAGVVAPAPSEGASLAVIRQAQQSEARGDVAAARQLLYAHLTASPYDVRALRELGRLEDRSGSLEHAEQHYRQALGADPTCIGAMNDLGLCQARKGDLEAAADTFRQAIAASPDKALYRNNLATVLVRLGQDDEALGNLSAVYDPATASFNLGQLMARSGRTDDAAARYEAALAVAPDFRPAQAALAALGKTRLVEATPAVAPAFEPGPEPTLAETEPAYVASAPVSETTPIDASIGAPIFPRLLPPVIDR